MSKKREITSDSCEARDWRRNKGEDELGWEEKRTRRAFLKSLLKAGVVLSLPLSSCTVNFFYNNGSNNEKDAYLSFEIEFSEPMNRDSVESAISVSPAIDGFLSKEPTWTNDDACVLYQTTVDNTDTVYTVTIDGTARDKAGNYLDGNGDGAGGDPYTFTIQGTDVPFSGSSLLGLF